MARKPARVDWIVHARTGVKVALRLNKGTMTFEAEYAGITYKSKDGAEIRKQILDEIERSHQLTFYPVIIVELEEPRYWGRSYQARAGGVLLVARRHYYSSDGVLRELSWEDHAAGKVDRLKRWNPVGYKGKPGDFALPYMVSKPTTTSSSYYYLPYTDEVWDGLQEIVKVIKQARDRLAVLLSAPSVIADLITIGTGTLYPLLESKIKEGGGDNGGD